MDWSINVFKMFLNNHNERILGKYFKLTFRKHIIPTLILCCKKIFFLHFEKMSAKHLARILWDDIE